MCVLRACLQQVEPQRFRLWLTDQHSIMLQPWKRAKSEFHLPSHLLHTYLMPG